MSRLFVARLAPVREMGAHRLGGLRGQIGPFNTLKLFAVLADNKERG
jgi:hypothetical protein